MALARSVLERLKSSDGRIRVKTLSGVSALVAAIALLVGVLPVMADHSPGGPLVGPTVVNYGGGSGACAVSLDGRLPSAAGKEFHINNPQANTSYEQDGITVTVRDRTTLPAGRVFDFTVSSTSGFVVYDVVVNGGPQNNHYDYDTKYGETEPPGPVDHDNNLHAPRKNNRTLHNLSHINICYDVPGVTLFACNEPVKLESNGLFAIAEARIFANSVLGCDGKRASFLIEDGGDAVTLAFTGDTGVKIAGRLDVTKEFPSTSFDDLTYDPEPPFNEADFVDVQWCQTRDFATGDGDEFSDWLPTGTESGLYPKLPDGETACKVAENEDLSGTQLTVVYFEFEDPQFR